MPTTRQQELQQRFEAFHAKHPDVFKEFKKLACDLRSRGRSHYGAKALMEIIRYQRIVSGKDEQESFKINNNYTSRYARLLVSEDRSYAGFFDMRQLRA